MIAEASPRLTPWSGILYTLVTFIACYFHRRTCFMSQETSPQNEAVFLFSGDAIDREMLYPEFEAILDGFVPMPENAGGTAKAVYVRIDGELRITAAVFFLLNFDPSGRADPHSNVRVVQLLAMDTRGQEMGAGRITLVCCAACLIGWSLQSLW